MRRRTIKMDEASFSSLRAELERLMIEPKVTGERGKRIVYVKKQEVAETCLKVLKHLAKKTNCIMLTKLNAL